jgi:hypothetical protein
MMFSPEQAAQVTSIVNDFGDAFAQDHTDDRMHEWLAIIRNEMVDDWCVPVWHPWLIPQLDWIDSILDRIEARRKSTVAHVAANLRSGPVGRYLN